MVSLLLLWHAMALLSIKYTLFNVTSICSAAIFLVLTVVVVVVCLLLLLVLHLIWPSFSPSYASRNIKDKENVGQTIVYPTFSISFPCLLLWIVLSLGSIIMIKTK